MSDREYDIWVFDQLNPNEKKMRGGKKERHIPAFLEPFPEHLIGWPDKTTEERKQIIEDEYLKSKGIE